MPRRRILETPPGGPFGFGILDRISDYLGGGFGDLLDKLFKH